MKNFTLAAVAAALMIAAPFATSASFAGAKDNKAKCCCTNCTCKDCSCSKNCGNTCTCQTCGCCKK